MVCTEFLYLSTVQQQFHVWLSDDSAEIMALLITTCTWTERGKSDVYGSGVRPHNADTTRNSVHRARHCSPYTAFIHDKFGSMLSCAKKFNCCLLGWFGKIHPATPFAETLLKRGYCWEAVKCACITGNTSTPSIRKQIVIWYFYDELQLKSSFHLGIPYILGNTCLPNK